MDLLKCSICNDTKPSSAFSPSAIKNMSQRIFRCYDCSRPPCMFIPKCTTCTKCRDEKCKKGARCTKSIETLNSKLLPATAEEVQKYACDKCRYVRCIVMQPDGSICGKERRANAKAKARRDKTDYKCGDCLTWLLSQDTLRKAAASTRSANWNGSTASHDLWAAFDILAEGLQQEYTWSGFRGFTIHALFVLTEVPIPLHCLLYTSDAADD